MTFLVVASNPRADVLASRCRTTAILPLPLWPPAAALPPFPYPSSLPASGYSAGKGHRGMDLPGAGH